MTTTTIIRAVYENGHLRPLDPLDLREGEQVKLRVEAENEISQEEKLRLALGDLVRWPDPSADADDDIDEEALLKEIQEAFRGQPPLSETIIQERQEGP
ncbi:MAG: antitoxin family protein [Chitinophagaceae bacterium]|nr:antitoxin family protein [Anaerolineae bacterium]